MPDEQTREIKAQLKRITDALLGDEEMGHIGMVAELKSVMVTVNQIQQERRDEKAEKRGTWRVITAISACAGTITAGAVEYFTRKP